ncbi:MULTISPECIES: DUF3024 domain-containing protein [unclassified Mycobacterium]|uniref:DUF3024 domain-containing protein n=1 Tax=unclassified Mycobacterium TaxID=2642494 RepID=UPI0029C84C87|nr:MULTISPECIES: DUF3024 domain-containing protein [unclassified Mycobacterium]
MPLPEEDVAVVRNWVEALNSDMPAHVASQLRYELDLYRNALTLVECRPTLPDDPGSDWFRVSFARLRFTRSRGWELYWADRDSNFHVYDLVEPTQDVATLLAEIDDDPTCIFFG